MKPSHQIQIVKTDTLAGGQTWYFRIVHRNGHTLAHSETYRNRADCKRAIANFVKAILKEEVETVEK